MLSDRVLTLGRMARRIGVSQKWLKTQAELHRVPHIKAGSSYLFEPAATEESVARLAARSHGEVANA